MKKALLAAVLLVGLGTASVAHADAPYEWIWNLLDSTSTPYTYHMDANPTPNEDRVLMYDPSDKQPALVPLNGGIHVDGTGHLSLDNVPISKIDGLQTALNGKAALSHSHSTSDISGLASYVDARIGSTTAFQADWSVTNTASSSYIKNKPSLSWATTTRSLNTAFQVSATRAAFVSYTVDIASTLSLLAGDTGTVILEYADDSGFTTNVVTVQSAANGNTGALTIGLNLTQVSTASLTGIVPAGKYIRLRTVNTAGSPTFTYRAQQEVLMSIN